MARFIPLLAIVAADVTMRPSLHGQDQAVVWRIWALAFALGAGIVVPRLSVQLTCTFLLLALVILTGFSIGLFYIPALGAAIWATLLQLDMRDSTPQLPRRVV